MNFDKLAELYPATGNVSDMGDLNNNPDYSPKTEWYYESVTPTTSKPEKWYHESVTSMITTNPPQTVEYTPVRDIMTGANKQYADNQEPVDYFKSWLLDRIDPSIEELLSDQGYLTEASLCTVLGLKSPLQNPFRFLYGDIFRYRKDMKELIVYCAYMLSDPDYEWPDGDVRKSVSYQRIQAVKQALAELDEEYGELCHD